MPSAPPAAHQAVQILTVAPNTWGQPPAEQYQFASVAVENGVFIVFAPGSNLAIAECPRPEDAPLDAQAIAEARMFDESSADDFLNLEAWVEDQSREA
jgi:hypothetical protein